MPIDTREITERQRDLILEIEEGHFADLKAIDIAPGKLTRSLAAFANADGGELYIGIDEDLASNTRTWRGFARVEDANGHIQPFEALFPLGTDFDYTFLRCAASAGHVLQIQVRKTADIKHATDGIVYVRRGAQNLPVTAPDALRRLEYLKGLASFETEVVDAPSEVITNSVPGLEFMLQVVPTAEPLAWMTKQRLVRDGRPSVAGLILFGEEPQALLPKRCGIKVYRYRTKAAEGTRETLAFTPLTVEGNAYSQIRAAVARAVSVVEEIRRLDLPPVAGTEIM